MLLNSGKHSVPQFPPRLKVQRLKPNQWARAPNRDQQLHALKLSDIRGWSMLCEDTVPMIALHIPEEDRGAILQRKNHFGQFLGLLGRFLGGI